MNQPITKIFFLFILVQFQFVSCIWLSTDIKYYDQIVKSDKLEFYNIKTVLIRMSEGDSQMIGDTLGFIECDGIKVYHSQDRYPRMDMKNSKIPDKLRAAIETVMPNVLFKSDYCSTIETKETLFLNETQWKTQVENYSYYTKGWLKSCTKTYYKNKTSISRSKFSERCNRIPEYSHTVDFTSDEIKMLAGNIEITSDYARSNIETLLDYVLNYVTLGIMPLSAKFDTNARFTHDYRYSTMLYSGTMSRSIWNYFIWPIWILIPGSKIRFGDPISHLPTSESLEEFLFFKVESFRKAAITRILKERL